MGCWLQRQRYPLIDVFIRTYNEEQSTLDTTIIAALGMKYPNFRGQLAPAPLEVRGSDVAVKVIQRVFR